MSHAFVPRSALGWAAIITFAVVSLQCSSSDAPPSGDQPGAGRPSAGSGGPLGAGAGGGGSPGSAGSSGNGAAPSAGEGGSAGSDVLGCASDLECEGEQICVSASCQAPECAGEGGCGAGQICSEGRCVLEPCDPPAIEFSYAPDDEAESVAVAGSFNSWNPTAAMLTFDDETGVWTGAFDIAPGSHQYKFVIDGSTWVPDPANPDGADDGFGGENSLIVIGCDGALPPTGAGGAGGAGGMGGEGGQGGASAGQGGGGGQQ